VVPIQPFIGAQIEGLDLTQPVEAGTAELLRSALAEYGVLVIRGQEISRTQHVEFAKAFSRRTTDIFTYQRAQSDPVPEHPEILTVLSDGKRNTAVDIWHTDESFRPIPPAASILRACILPSFGGDTVFSNAAKAYERLSDDIKEEIRGLKALHGPAYGFYLRGASRSLAAPENMKKYLESNPPHEQPVVRRHPVTGVPVLYVNQKYTGPIVGLDQEESRDLLKILCDQIAKPDYQMRVKWELGTIVVWDNCLVQHYAVNDYSEPRRLERVTIAGECAPVGLV